MEILIVCLIILLIFNNVSDYIRYKRIRYNLHHIINCQSCQSKEIDNILFELTHFQTKEKSTDDYNNGKTAVEIICEINRRLIGNLNRITEIAETLNIRLDCDLIAKISKTYDDICGLAASVDAKHRVIDEKINVTRNEVHEQKMILQPAAKKIDYLYNDRRTIRKGKTKLKTAKNQQVNDFDAVDQAEVSQD